MVNGINLSTLSDLLAKISKKENVTELSRAEKDALKEIIGSNGSVNNCCFERNYKAAMEKIGAENEEERNQVLEQIKNLITQIVNNAKDKNAAISAINQLFHKVANADDAKSALTELINGLQSQCGISAPSQDNTPETKLKDCLSEFLSQDKNITYEDYENLINLLGENGIAYTVKTKPCGCKRIIFTDKDGKKYSITANQIPEEKLVDNYMDTQVNAQTFDSTNDLEHFINAQGLSLTTSEPADGKVTVSYTDNNGKTYTATVVIETELPTYSSDDVSNAGINSTQEPYTRYLAYDVETGEFSINRDIVSKDFAEWEKENGPITTLEDLKKAMGKIADITTGDLDNTPTDCDKAAKIEKMIENFIKGSTTNIEFNKQLADLGVKEVATNNDSTNYNFAFTVDGVTYHVSGISKEKVRNGNDNDIFGFTKMELADISPEDINKYFDIAAWQGDDKEKGVMGYVLKDEWREKLGDALKDGMNISQVMDAVTNYKPSNPFTPSIDDNGGNAGGSGHKGVNDIIREFIKGNLTASEFNSAIQETLNGKFIKTNAGKNGIYDFEFTVDGQTYTINGIAVESVKNGTANDNVAALADDLKGLTNEQIEEYFIPVAWNGDKVIGYILNDDAKTKFGFSDEDVKAGITLEKLVKTIQSYRDVSENEINNALNNIKKLEELAEIAGVTVSIIKDSSKNKFEVQIQYNGKTYPDGESPKFLNSDQFKAAQNSEILRNFIKDGVIVENIEDLLRGFATGNINSTQFNNLLNNRFGVDQNDIKLNDGNDGAYYNFTFNYNGNEYTVSGIEKEKVNNEKANDIVTYSKTEIDSINAALTSTGVDVSSYFDVTVSCTDKDGTETTLCYTLNPSVAEALKLTENSTPEEIKAAIIKDARSEANKLPSINSLEDVWKIAQDKNNLNYGKIHVEYIDNKFIVTVDGIRASKSLPATEENQMIYDVYLNTSSDNKYKGMKDIIENVDDDKKLNVYKQLKELTDSDNVAKNINETSNILNKLKAAGFAVDVTGSNSNEYTITVKDNNNKTFTVNKKFSSDEVEDLEDYGFIESEGFKDLKAAIKALDLYTSSANVPNLDDKIKGILEDLGIKEKLKEMLQNAPYNKDESEFDEIYKKLQNELGTIQTELGAVIKQNEENRYDVKISVIIDKLLEKLEVILNEDQKADRQELRKTRDTIVNTLKTNLNLDETYKDVGSLKSNANSFLKGLKENIKNEIEKLDDYKNIFDWENGYEKAIADYLNKYNSTNFSESITKEDILKGFVKSLLNKIKNGESNTTGTSAIDFSKVEGYKTNETVSDFNVLGDVKDALEKKIKELVNKAKDSIRTYVENQFNKVKISDEELNDIISELVGKLITDDATNTKKLITKGENSYTFKTKDVLDQFAKELKAYVNDKNNNPNNQSYSETEFKQYGLDVATLEKAGYITKTSDGKYKLNISKLDEEYSTYVSENGSITTLDKLKAAMNLELETKIQSQEDSVLGKMNAYSNTNVTLQFKIDKNGDIVFVDRNQDVFAAQTDTTANKIFGSKDGKLAESLFDVYKKELDVLFGKNEQAKKNLYNIALQTVLAEQMEELKNTKSAKDIIKDVNAKFVELMQQAAKNNKAYEYITKYHEQSVLSGKTTENIGKSVDYTYGSTNGSDDMVSVKTSNQASYTYEDKNYKIEHLCSGVENDDNKANEAIDNLLKLYLDKYKNYLEIEKIVELFNSAEEVAFKKLQDGIEINGDEDRTVYGYGNGGNRDTYYGAFVSVQAILIQIMFELENSINKEVLGIQTATNDT